MNSFSAVYSYHTTYYTGTLFQPDALSLFIKAKKDEKDFLICHAEPMANIYGKWVPIAGSYVGVARVVEAVKSIFKNLSNKTVSEPNALWIAFKNLFRGIVEFIPFSGVFLIFYDSLRNSITIHAKIAKEIQQQKNIAGIAMDGKVIFSIDLEQLDNILSKNPTSDKERLAILTELCLQFLKKQELGKNGIPFKMTEIFPVLKETFNKKNN